MWHYRTHYRPYHRPYHSLTKVGSSWPHVHPKTGQIDWSILELLTISIWNDFLLSDQCSQFSQWKCIQLSTVITIDSFLNFIQISSGHWGEGTFETFWNMSRGFTRYHVIQNIKVYRGTKRDSARHYAIKPLDMDKIGRAKLNEYFGLVKLRF